MTREDGLRRSLDGKSTFRLPDVWRLPNEWFASSRMQPGNELRLLDMIATLRSRSRTSFMFDLGTKSDTLDIPVSDRTFSVSAGRVYNVFGWIDVHYPCEGSHPLQVRMGLPDERVSWETMRDTIAELRNYFDVPQDGGYRIYLTGLTKQTSMEDPTGGIVSTGWNRWANYVVAPKDGMVRLQIEATLAVLGDDCRLN